MLTGFLRVPFQGGLWRELRLERAVITWVCSARTSSQIRILAPLSWRIRKQSVNAFGQPEPDDRVKGAPDHQIGGFWANVNPSLYEHLELLQPCCHDNECYILPAAHCSGPAGLRTMRPGLKAGLLSISEAISQPHQALNLFLRPISGDLAWIEATLNGWVKEQQMAGVDSGLPWDWAWSGLKWAMHNDTRLPSLPHVATSLIRQEADVSHRLSYIWA
ncbi:hypothetical protein AOLI_G00119130 [Acnodon oligacanthus]